MALAQTKPVISDPDYVAQRNGIALGPAGRSTCKHQSYTVRTKRLLFAFGRAAGDKFAEQYGRARCIAEDFGQSSGGLKFNSIEG